MAAVMGVTWLLFPLLLAGLALCFGLLIERAGGHRLPDPLLYPVGFAGLVCATQATTLHGATAPLTPYLVAALAIAGGVLGRGRIRGVLGDGWTAALALGVFLLFAAPALLTGEPTILGYTSLGDAAGHFGIVDRLMQHGYSVAGLPKSSFQNNAMGLFLTSYPAGSHSVLGVGRAFVGTDVAWLLQPYLALLATFSALGLHSLLSPFASRRWQAAWGAGLAISAGLVYSYSSNEQAIKELGALTVIVAAVGVVRPLLAAPPTWRAGFPAAVVVGGGLGVLSVALAPWIGPLLLIAAVSLLITHRRRLAPVLIEFAGFAAFAAVLALPALSRLGAFVAVSGGVLTNQDLGNLGSRLPLAEALGVWPAIDFRQPLEPGFNLAVAMVGVAALGALLGAIAVVRRRAWPVGLFAVVSVIGFAAVAGSTSPWAWGKALMLLSPVALLLGAFAVIAWWPSGGRPVVAILGVALTLGVLWTDARTYHVTDASPYARLSELSALGERYAGKGPSMYFEAEEFGKHFLRQTDPTSATEGLVDSAPGRIVRTGISADADDYEPALLSRFRLLVLRQGPDASRPPADFARVRHGRYYDVWRRQPGPRVLGHVPLGSRLDPAAAAPCPDVRRLAGLARAAGGRLAYAPRPALSVLRVIAAPAPAGWFPDPDDPESLRPTAPGRVVGEVGSGRGRFGVWLEGSFGRPVRVYVDDREVGSVRDQVNPRLVANRIGTVRLGAGRHSVRLDLSGGSLDPRNGSRNRVIGPVYLTPAADPGKVAVRTVPPGAWRSVCGEHADWIEAVGAR